MAILPNSRPSTGWRRGYLTNNCIKEIFDVDYGTKIKINPKCNNVPDRPNWAPLLIVCKGNVVSS